MSPSTIRDRIAFRTTLGPLKAPAFSVVSALQDFPKDVQVEALFLVTFLTAQGIGLDPHELISRAARQVSDANAVRNPIIEAIEAYAAGELR
jgi:hypothetical protein